MALVQTILCAAASISAVFAVPIPLHNTNNQRLPDHPISFDQSDYSAIVTVQKHKHVLELVAPILRLCGRSFQYEDLAL